MGIFEIRPTVDAQFRVVAFAAGLKSVGNESGNRYADSLLEGIDLGIVEDNARAFVKYLVWSKSFPFISLLPAVEDVLQTSDYGAVRSVLSRLTQDRLEVLVSPLADMATAGIDVLPYKGIDLIHSFPNTAGERFVWDVDPLVPFDELSLADEVLRSHGFTQGNVDQTRLDETTGLLRLESVSEEDRSWVLNNHHELHPYFKILAPDWALEYADLIADYGIEPVLHDRPYVLANIDLHHSIAAGFEPSDIWPARRTVSIDGRVFGGLSVEAYLCLYLGRTYSVTHTLNDSAVHTLYDAVRVVCGAVVDWAYLRYLVGKYRLTAPAFYVLSEISAIVGSSLVPDVELEHYAKELVENRQYDLGDFTGKLLGQVSATSLKEYTERW
ncbi:nucleotidyltransferase family protein [Rhodococcus erythropolis]|uniref:nucleotidyltransferase family protein n=1 Tax=Rhodococcus erythropolis TaxID=1833 RepID=UPI001BEC8E09|nr:nucleotidyltransferase family protein [Rhodococcus erythropolis]MBT2269018.1 nucleotidyltransferase family protein [Rhodococcus erythropolis]